MLVTNIIAKNNANDPKTIETASDLASVLTTDLGTCHKILIFSPPICSYLYMDKREL